MYNAIWIQRSHLREDISLTQKLEVAIDNGFYLLDKCAELRNTCNKLTNENTQLRNGLEQSIISSKKLSKEIRQLLTDAKNVLNLEQQSFELQTVKTECGVYKQYVSDMAKQSMITKYQTSIPFPEKQNKVSTFQLPSCLEISCTTASLAIGDCGIESSSVKRNTIIIFTLSVIVIASVLELTYIATSSTRSLHTEWFKDPNNLKLIKAAGEVTGLVGVSGLTMYGAEYMVRKEVQNELKALEARLETRFTGLETHFTGLETHFTELETRC
ncbi:hypothetical protein RhiirA4_465245 [Rhizophagus irregularis]|uniref:Uncharacterized protein n=1 Tax=Rhizophagus irregularis TaxID=588596 RepID=A0A2I1GRP6_9GLOM|nr:hypothetical protein RhiirA4_465245 [Rhizophagus irregularis]